MEVYLDNAATSWPKPPAVYEAVSEYMRNIGASPGRSGHRQAMAANRIVYAARNELATLLGVRDEENIIFTLNATDGMNMALKGLLQHGDHVITSALEHNAVMRPLMGMVERQGVNLTIIPYDPVLGMDPEALRGAINNRTRCIVMTHASNVSGQVLPVAEVGLIAAEYGLVLIVDGAQTAGTLPVDLQSMGAHFYVFTGHKGLLGPQGTGGLYVESGHTLLPWREGGTGSRSASDRQPDFLPDALEAGTPNTPGIAGLLAGVSFIREKTPEQIHRHELALRQKLVAAIADIPGMKLCVPHSCADLVGVLSFSITGKDVGVFGDDLDRRFGIACRTGLHCAPHAHRSLGTYPEGTVRFSFGVFNTEAEVEYVAKAVRELSKT
jgi:cysteine desulfurase / selenocysteine lyase